MRIIKMMALALGLTALVACGGGSGSSSTDAIPTTKVSTTIELAGTQTADARLARAAAISVTLTLSNGKTYTMSSDGNGVYSCQVQAFADGSVGYIEAHAGDIVLKNFFDSITDADGEANLGVTNPDTTLFVDVLEAYVGSLSANANDASAAELLSGFADATLDINVTTLKASVAEDAEYETLRQTYTANLTWENYESEVEVDMDTIASETISTLVSTGGVVVEPAETSDDGSASDDTTSDAAVAQQIGEAIFTAYTEGDYQTLMTYVDSDNFLNEGYNFTEWAQGVYDEIQEIQDAGYTLEINDYNVTTEALSDDLYAVYIAAKQSVSDADGNVISEEAFDDAVDITYQHTPMLVQKTGDTWAFIGNQKKSEFWSTAAVYQNAVGEYYARVWAEVTSTSSYPVESVTGTFGFLSGPVEMLVNPYDDNNEFHVYLNEDEGYAWTGGAFAEGITWTGDICTDRDAVLDVTYEDGSTDSLEYTLPECPTEADVADLMPSIDTITKNADGTVTINFTLTDSEDLAQATVWVYDNKGGYTVYEADSMPFSKTSLVVDPDVFSSGSEYRVEIEIDTIGGWSFGTDQVFTY